jgi:hypothetical protein
MESVSAGQNKESTLFAAVINKGWAIDTYRNTYVSAI